jgi:hypothetical protein
VPAWQIGGAGAGAVMSSHQAVTPRHMHRAGLTTWASAAAVIGAGTCVAGALHRRWNFRRASADSVVRSRRLGCAAMVRCCSRATGGSEQARRGTDLRCITARSAIGQPGGKAGQHDPRWRRDIFGHGACPCSAGPDQSIQQNYGQPAQ